MFFFFPPGLFHADHTLVPLLPRYRERPPWVLQVESQLRLREERPA